MQRFFFVCVAVAAFAAFACDRAEREQRAADAPGAAPSGSTAPAPVPAGAIDPEATGFEYPFPVRFFELTTQRQRLKMAYLDVAPERPKGIALLLHGKNFSAAYWEATIRSLTRAGYRVIAPDQVGFGKSSKPERYQYSFAALADNTRALLASLGVESSAVIGHSMGGMLAVRCALAFPERVTKLVLINPIGLEDYAAVLPYRPVDELYRKELEQTPDKIREYQKKAYFAGSWKPEYEALIRLPAGWTLHPDYARVAWSSALTYDMIFTQPVVHDLHRLRVSTALIIGLRDRTALGRDTAPPEVASTLGNYPELGRRARNLIPSAELIELPGAGHLPQVEAFAEYEKALLGVLGSGSKGREPAHGAAGNAASPR